MLSDYVRVCPLKATDMSVLETRLCVYRCAAHVHISNYECPCMHFAMVRFLLAQHYPLP